MNFKMSSEELDRLLKNITCTFQRDLILLKDPKDDARVKTSFENDCLPTLDLFVSGKK
jgi:hypothetical protein